MTEDLGPAMAGISQRSIRVLRFLIDRSLFVRLCAISDEP
jgi:hypothetical protein